MDIDQTTFAAEAALPETELAVARANLLLAREIAYPGLALAPYWQRLETLQTAAEAAVGAQSGALQQGLALAQYLFQTAGFRGNQAAYDDPRNSYLNEVLDRRLGLPISLSALYLHLGRRLGLPVHGVGLPGHFIVSVSAEAEILYLDPFFGGQPLSRADCARRVAQATGQRGEFDPRWLDPTPDRAILARMLNNLRQTYTHAEDWPRTIKVLERLRELQPEAAVHLRDLGLIHYKTGARHAAVHYFSQYLAAAHAAPDADSIRQSRNLLLDELARLN